LLGQRNVNTAGKGLQHLEVGTLYKRLKKEIELLKVWQQYNKWNVEFAAATNTQVYIYSI
jgi:hypothetical protein